MGAEEASINAPTMDSRFGHVFHCPFLQAILTAHCFEVSPHEWVLLEKQTILRAAGNLLYFSSTTQRAYVLLCLSSKYTAVEKSQGRQSCFLNNLQLLFLFSFGIRGKMRETPLVRRTKLPRWTLDPFLAPLLFDQQLTHVACNTPLSHGSAILSCQLVNSYFPVSVTSLRKALFCPEK